MNPLNPQQWAATANYLVPVNLRCLKLLKRCERRLNPGDPFTKQLAKITEAIRDAVRIAHGAADPSGMGRPTGRIAPQNDPALWLGDGI